MGENKPFNFVAFVSANEGKSVSGFDYLHAIYTSQSLPPDFIVWMAKLYCPEFKVVNGIVFISEIFDDDRYQSLLRDGRSPTEVQFWMNLLEITGLFDDLSCSQAMVIAESLATSWNLKLSAEFGNDSALARAVHDSGTGEVFVTIGGHG